MPLDTVMNSMQHQSELSVTNLPLVSAPRGSCRATQETHLKDRRYYDWGSVCEQKGVRYEAGSHLCAEGTKAQLLFLVAQHVLMSIFCIFACVNRFPPQVIGRSIECCGSGPFGLVRELAARVDGRLAKPVLKCGRYGIANSFGLCRCL